MVLGRESEGGPGLRSLARSHAHSPHPSRPLALLLAVTNFWQLNREMLSANARIAVRAQRAPVLARRALTKLVFFPLSPPQVRHNWESTWHEWPLNSRGVLYYSKDVGQAYTAMVYLLGACARASVRVCVHVTAHPRRGPLAARRRRPRLHASSTAACAPSAPPHTAFSSRAHTRCAGNPLVVWPIGGLTGASVVLFFLYYRCVCAAAWARKSALSAASSCTRSLARACARPPRRYKREPGLELGLHFAGFFSVVGEHSPPGSTRTRARGAALTSPASRARAPP